MKKKELVNYARELFKRGFTKDAARGILLSKGVPVQEVDRALIIASSPEKTISLTLMLGFAGFLVILLIPLMIFLAPEQPDLETPDYDSTTQFESEESYQPPSELQTYQCAINEECLFNEICTDGTCSKLFCTSCEEIINHECISLQCEDNNTCTQDYCIEGTCSNDLITTCISGDGCCPTDCNQTLDLDCITLNTTLDECTTDIECYDGDYLTTDVCKTEGNNTIKKCFNIFPGCQNNDLVCGANCTSLDDNDCDPICGNNIIEETEICDGDCPQTQTDCTDNNTCTIDTLLGSSQLCTSECSYTDITICSSGDGCCPTDCLYINDSDCPPASTLLSTTPFTSIQRTTTGMANLYFYEDNTHSILLSNLFSISNAELSPDLGIYLATKAIVNTKEDLDAGNMYLGELTALSGLQEYQIVTPITNINDFNSIVIYHSSYNAVYSYTTLNYNQ